MYILSFKIWTEHNSQIFQSMQKKIVKFFVKLTNNQNWLNNSTSTPVIKMKNKKK